MLSLWLCSLALAACTDTLDEAAVPKPLSVAVNARDITARAPIHGTALPDASNIGISLVAEDGTPYDGVAYDNLKYTAAGTAPDQTWSTPNIPTLSSTPAKLVAYYPWAENTDYSAVPVETDTQTDYMYSQWLTGLSNANPNANIVMKHALTAVRVALVKGDFTADVDVSSVSVKSPAFATAGAMDATTGTLSALTGIGDAVTVTADFPLTAQATNVEVMAVPDVSVSSGVTTVTTQIGDRKYSVNINFTEGYKQGYIYTYTLTLNNTGMEVTSVAVTPWEEGTTDNGELIPFMDNKYIVKIVTDTDGYTFKHNMQNFIGTVDWGDGTTSAYDNVVSSPTHTYSTAAEYTVTATGTMFGITSMQMLNTYPYLNPMATPIYTELIHIGKDMGIKDMTFAFGWSNLTEIPAGIFDGLTEVVSFAGTFAYCEKITSSIPTGLFEKCTEVTNFSGTFMGCEKLTGTIPEGLFDKCTKVTDFSSTFEECKGLTGSIPEGLFDNCPDVTTFNSTFNWCSGLTGEIPEGLFNNNTKVTSFNWTFYACDKIEAVDLTKFFVNCTEVEDFTGTFMACNAMICTLTDDVFKNNTKVKTFENMFAGCLKMYGQIPEGLFRNCAEATDFRCVFLNCPELTGSIPEKLFENNIKATDISWCFKECSGLTGTIPANLFKNNTEVTTFDNCFSGCKGLTAVTGDLFKYNLKVTDFSYAFQKTSIVSIPEGLFDNCPDVTTFECTFEGCTKLTGSIPTGLFDCNRKVTNFRATFWGASGLTGESPYTTIKVDGNDVKVHLYERSLYPEHFTAPSDGRNCFWEIDNLTDIEEMKKASGDWWA